MIVSVIVVVPVVVGSSLEHGKTSVTVVVPGGAWVLLVEVEQGSTSVTVIVPGTVELLKLAEAETGSTLVGATVLELEQGKTSVTVIVPGTLEDVVQGSEVVTVTVPGTLELGSMVTYCVDVNVGSEELKLETAPRAQLVDKRSVKRVDLIEARGYETRVYCGSELDKRK